MPVKQVTDMFGRPLVIQRGWYFEGHRSRSDDEKNALARAALVEEGKEWVQTVRAEGNNVKFDHVELIGNENQGSDTSQSWDGTRRHKCWGTGIGHLFVDMP